MVTGVCCRRLSASVTLHGGPVVLRAVEATPCLKCKVHMFMV